MLANDSCFLVRPLDDVFAEMDRRPGDWWSLQATSMEFNEDDVGEDASMPLADAKRDLVGPRRWAEVDYLHLSSYFQVLRRPVLDDEGFRYRLDTVGGQRTKQLVVDKYETSGPRTKKLVKAMTCERLTISRDDNPARANNCRSSGAARAGRSASRSACCRIA